jgi:hypothetical protein
MNMNVIPVVECYGLTVKHWVTAIQDSKWFGKQPIRVGEEVTSMQCTYMWL